MDLKFRMVYTALFELYTLFYLRQPQQLIHSGEITFTNEFEDRHSPNDVEDKPTTPHMLRGRLRECYWNS